MRSAKKTMLTPSATSASSPLDHQKAAQYGGQISHSPDDSESSEDDATEKRMKTSGLSSPRRSGIVVALGDVMKYDIFFGGGTPGGIWIVGRAWPGRL